MTRAHLVSQIYNRGPKSALSPEQAAARNAQLRREIWRGTGWAVIDLDAVGDDWVRQAIKNECVKQNGGR